MPPHASRVRYREARAQAIIVVIIGWISVFAFVGVGTGNRSDFGLLKWSDFVQFYTLGNIARTHESALLYDGAAQHVRQVALVPESAEDHFVPVYAPQTAVLFAWLSVFPYVTAGFIWALVTMGIYGWAVWLAWRPSRDTMSDRTFLVAATLGFPPVWQLVMYGQTTAVVLLAFVGAWWAFEADRRVLAGVALSLIAIKPQFGLVLAPVAILAGEWRLIAGAVIGVGFQTLAVLAAFDRSVFSSYVAVVRRLPTLTRFLEPEPYKMHSLRVLTRLLPGRADLLVWCLLSTAIIVVTAAVWRHARPWRLRFGLLVLASVLVNPHLAIYDAALLAPAFIWIGGWLLEQRTDSGWYWQLVYWISVAFLIPTAAIVRVQVSPILLTALFIQSARLVLRADGRAVGLPQHPSLFLS